jgi:hypothetical protein
MCSININGESFLKRNVNESNRAAKSLAKTGGKRMLFMVIEQFKDAEAVYRRVRERGRMLPEGLRYVKSWVEADCSRCFQLIECDDASLFHKWVIQLQDLVDFEIVAVIESKQTDKAI